MAVMPYHKISRKSAFKVRYFMYSFTIEIEMYVVGLWVIFLVYHR